MDTSGNLDDSLTQLMKKTIEKCREDGYILCPDGIFTASAISNLGRVNKRLERAAYEPDKAEFDYTNPRLRLLFSILPLILKKSDRKHIYSYGGKHVIEKLFRHSYISNGELILACIALGYKFKYETDTPNCNIYGQWVNTIPGFDIGDWHTWHFDC